MTRRLIWLWLAAGAGILLLLAGLLMPAHIRATDASVLRAAGRQTASLGQTAHALLREHKPGPAALLTQLLEAEGLPESAALATNISKLSREQPLLALWGGPPPKWSLGGTPRKIGDQTEPLTDYIVRKENRDRLIGFLAESRHPGAAGLLKCRQLTNTVIFSPSWTSSGQAFDAALAISGLLMIENHLSPALDSAIRELARKALDGQDSRDLEQTLLDIMSLGQRLNWHQLCLLTRAFQGPESLREFTGLARRTESDLPALYSGVVLSANAAGLTRYAMSFADTGPRDLRGGMHYNAGGLRLLIERGKRLRHSPADAFLKSYMPFDLLPALAWGAPMAALALKWLLYLSAGYMFALATHFLVRRRAGRHGVFGSENSPGDFRIEPGHSLVLPPVRGFHVARELLFALGFLAVVLLVTEPFLTLDTQRVEFPIRLRLPMAEAPALSAPQTAAHTSFMNQLSLLTLLLFFVLQALIYTACMFKLAEIRRQKVGPRMKLKLLDNEDHLFDAGLYLGFVGTIISLILVSLGVIKPSLMAAYSSTSFGIIFVSCFKIFNLRPIKRQLILEAEAVSPEGAFTEIPRPQAAP